MAFIYRLWVWQQIESRIINSNAIYCLKRQIQAFRFIEPRFSPNAVSYRKKKGVRRWRAITLQKLLSGNENIHIHTQEMERKKDNTRRKKIHITLSCRQPSTNAMVMHFIHGKGKWTFRIVDKLRRTKKKIVWVYKKKHCN